jgi:hypothetical protein
LTSGWKGLECWRRPGEGTDTHKESAWLVRFKFD